jgi:hypothetical protein
MMSSLPIPAVVAHVDWGVGQLKRWLVRAVRQGNGDFRVQAPVPVEPTEVFALARGTVTTGPVLVGFDFPIGLPSRYAEKAGGSGFVEVLPKFGQGAWRDFFTFAERPEQVHVHRPFYPRRPGGTRRDHLARGLGLEFHQLLRQCDRKTSERREACPVFWILGGQQVGRGACLGWQEVLQPALATGRIAIWPFAGNLEDLLGRHELIVVETYPAEFYGHLFEEGALARLRAVGKRKQAGRTVVAPCLFQWAERCRVALDDNLTRLIEDGFGDKRSAEDQFDAAVGCFGMLNVLLGFRPHAEPTSAVSRRIEGWIFGQEPARARARPLFTE